MTGEEGYAPLIWLGIALCLTQSAIFSGLNLAVFSLSRLRLEVEAGAGSPPAQRVLALRRDPNYTLTTILWGNVGINVLLTLLSHSVLFGAAAFLFSTFFITIFGEILPQAYFSRHALRVANALAPLLIFYRMLLYPLAKPSALLLDRLLGNESPAYLREKEMREYIRRHMVADGVEIDRVEGLGALNFLTLDDLPVGAEGEPIEPDSIIRMTCDGGLPQFPSISRSPEDPFLQQVNASGEHWVIIVDEDGTPVAALDADGFIREALFRPPGVAFRPLRHCHRPIVVTDRTRPLGEVIGRWKVQPETPDDNVVDNDVIVVWGEEKRVITGSDLLGHLLDGITKVEKPA